MTRPARIPGFAAPQAVTPTTDPDVPAGDDPDPDPHDLQGVWSDRGTRQVNFRLRIPLHHRYRLLLRELDHQDFETSFTEIVHAMLLDGPRTADEAKALVRRWRQVTAA